MSAPGESPDAPPAGPPAEPPAAPDDALAEISDDPRPRGLAALESRLEALLDRTPAEAIAAKLEALRFLVVPAVVLLAFVLHCPSPPWAAERLIPKDFNTLDGSWQISSPWRMNFGEWAGRDYTFTYGPLHQVVHGVGLLLPQGDAASLLRWGEAVPTLLALIALWVTLASTGARLGWRAGLFLLLTMLVPVWLKPLAAPAMIGLCLRSLGNDGCPTTRRPLRLLLWAGTAPALMLYAFDMGLMAFLGLLGLLLASWLSTLGAGRFGDDGEGVAVEVGAFRRRLLEALLALLIGAAVSAGLLQLFGFGRFLPEAFELAMGYTRTMSVGFERRKYATWMIVAVGLATVLGLLGGLVLRGALKRGHAPGPVLLAFGLALIGALWVRYGLTRADRGHVWLALAPFFVASIGVLPAVLARYRLRCVALLILLTLPWFALKVAIPVWPESQIAVWTGRLSALSELSAEPARIRCESPELLAATRLLELGRRDQPILCWPFQTGAAVVAGRREATATLQSYAATTPALQQLCVDAMRAEQPRILLFHKSWAIDLVPNRTRTSRLFRALLEDAELVRPPVDGLFELRVREPGVRRVATREVTDFGPRSSFEPGRETLQLDLSRADLRASDMILLRLRSARTRRFGIRKEGRIHLRYALSSGATVEHPVLLPADGQEHELLISAMDLQSPAMAAHFAPGRHWRSPESIVHLTLRWMPLDWLTVRPAKVEVLSVAVLTRPGVDTREVDRDAAESGAFRAWLFGRVGKDKR